MSVSNSSVAHFEMLQQLTWPVVAWLGHKATCGQMGWRRWYCRRNHPSHTSTNWSKTQRPIWSNQLHCGTAQTQHATYRRRMRAHSHLPHNIWIRFDGDVFNLITTLFQNVSIAWSSTVQCTNVQCPIPRNEMEVNQNVFYAIGEIMMIIYFPFILSVILRLLLLLLRRSFHYDFSYIYTHTHTGKHTHTLWLFPTCQCIPLLPGGVCSNQSSCKDHEMNTVDSDSHSAIQNNKI